MTVLFVDEMLKNTIEKPLFCERPVTYLSGGEIVRSVRSILQSRMAVTKYDRVELARQFLDHFVCMNRPHPLEALATFRIDSTLSSSNGNSCVGLALDLLRHLPPEIQGYLCAAILSNRYQQYSGPTYCHVTPVIRYQNPRDSLDQGYVLLDPSFHIAEPILLQAERSYAYDMGKKKGLWCFTCRGDKIDCQAQPAEGVTWSKQKAKDHLMIYRTDRIDNPEASSAMPMFVIDRSYPIVSRSPDGSQRAHINLDMNQKVVRWKVGEQKKDPIPFERILSEREPFDQQLADLLLIDRIELNATVKYVIEHAPVLDSLYNSFLDHLKSSSRVQELYVRNVC